MLIVFNPNPRNRHRQYWQVLAQGFFLSPTTMLTLACQRNNLYTYRAWSAHLADRAPEPSP